MLLPTNYHITFVLILIQHKNSVTTGGSDTISHLDLAASVPPAKKKHQSRFNSFTLRIRPKKSRAKVGVS